MADSSFPLGTNPSRRRQTAKEVFDGFNEWTIESVMSFRAPDCIQEIVPKSIGHPPHDNASYQQFFTSVLSHIEDFKLTVHDLLEDKEENKISMWMSSTANSAVGPFVGEYILILYFDEAGEKVTKLVEFVDSKAGTEFFVKLVEFIQAKKSDT